MSNTITDLRAHLFATLDALRDKEAPMEIERAKAISDVAQTIINTAKVEVDHLRATGGGGSRFLDNSESSPPAETRQGGRERLQTGTRTVTEIAPGATLPWHRARG